MTERWTLMAVHAHPDDECMSTGGVLARYAREGIRTVLASRVEGCHGHAVSRAWPGPLAASQAVLHRLPVLLYPHALRDHVCHGSQSAIRSPGLRSEQGRGHA
jgi:hypothetical protein